MKTLKLNALSFLLLPIHTEAQRVSPFKMAQHWTLSWWTKYNLNLCCRSIKSLLYGIYRRRRLEKMDDTWLNVYDGFLKNRKYRSHYNV